jgi:hypothetical protein
MKQQIERRLQAIEQSVPEGSAPQDWESPLLARAGLTADQARERFGGLPELAYALMCEPGKPPVPRTGESYQSTYMRMLSARKGQ